MWKVEGGGDIKGWGKFKTKVDKGRGCSEKQVHLDVCGGGIRNGLRVGGMYKKLEWEKRVR